jgi:hypothetical protein
MRVWRGPLDFDQARSYRTEPNSWQLCCRHYGGVAQLVRALACHARGRGFEPRRSRHRINDLAHILITRLLVRLE